MLGFERTRGLSSINNITVGLQGEIDAEQSERLARIQRYWDFYEGYHWENLPEQDGVELTFNYCRAFVTKYVAFELGDSFTYSVHKNAEDAVVSPSGQTLFEYIESVWVDNKQYQFSNIFGQMKAITGEAWVQVRYVAPGEEPDPFNKYPEGRVRLILHPTHIVFPEYAPHDRDRLTKVTLMYTYEKEEQSKWTIRAKSVKKKVLYKQIWTDTECTVIDDGVVTVFPNKYGVIPFVKTNNLDIAGRTEGMSDLEDLIPLNIAYNQNESHISEIIDYHSAPVTLIYGAKIGQLEKGANKLWGGLPKDARVENLEMSSDLASSREHIDDIKLAMCEIGGMPETTLGGAQAVSNTSGVALQYMNLPLIDRTKMKRNNTEDGLERINEMIILVSLFEGLIYRPANLTLREMLYTEVSLPDTLPKDVLLELQTIQMEMQLGLEHRKGAMRRLGKENIEAYLAEIDKEREEHPDLFGMLQNGDFGTQINSGMLNGNNLSEEVNKEINGENKASEVTPEVNN